MKARLRRAFFSSDLDTQGKTGYTVEGPFTAGKPIMSLVRNHICVIGLTVLLLAQSLSAQSARRGSNRQDQNSGGLPTLTQYFELLSSTISMLPAICGHRRRWNDPVGWHHLHRHPAESRLWFADYSQFGRYALQSSAACSKIQPLKRRYLESTRIRQNSRAVKREYSYFAERRGDWYWLAILRIAGGLAGTSSKASISACTCIRM